MKTKIRSENWKTERCKKCSTIIPSQMFGISPETQWTLFFEVAYFKGETPPAPDHVGHFPKNITEEIRDRIPRLSIIKSAIEAKKKELEVKMSRASVSTFFDQIGAGDEGVEQLEAFWDGSEPNTWDERSPRERNN